MHMARIFLLIFAVFIVISCGMHATLSYLTLPPVEAAPPSINTKKRVLISTPTAIPTRIPIKTAPLQTITTTQAQNVTIPPINAVDQQQSTSEYLLEQVNNYRKANGLSLMYPTPETCSFAQTRAGEISTNFTHEGFTNRITNHMLPYSSYSIATENIALNSNSMEVVSQWINSPIHAENMKKNTQFACIGISGNYFVFEGLSH